MENEKLMNFLDTFLLITAQQRKAIIACAPTGQIRVLTQLISLCQELDETLSVFQRKRRLARILWKCHSNPSILRDYLLENMGSLVQFIQTIQSNRSIIARNEKFTLLTSKFYLKSKKNKRKMKNKERNWNIAFKCRNETGNLCHHRWISNATTCACIWACYWPWLSGTKLDPRLSLLGFPGMKD